MKTDKNTKILVLCLPGIGDALMATPMIKLLKVKHPEAVIEVACMFGAIEYVFKNNPNVSATHKLSLYKENRFVGLRQILALRKNKYDISILAFPAFRCEYHLVHWLLGAKKKIAHKFTKGFWSEFNFLDTDLIEVDENEHNVINNLNLLRVLEIDWHDEISRDDIKYDLVLDKADIEFGTKYIKDLGWEGKNIVGIHPGSTDSPMGLLKRWPIERYAEVAKSLVKNNHKKILIFVGPNEKDIGRKLFDLIGDTANCHLFDNVDFKNALGILSSIDLLVCNDNGFGHLAAALGKKALVLMAPTNDKWISPYGADKSYIIRPPGFSPWYRYDLKREIPSHVEDGIKMITTDSIFERLEQLI